MNLPPSKDARPSVPAGSRPPVRRRRRLLIVLIVAVLAAGVVTRLTLFGISRTDVDPATYDGTAAMAARLHDIFLSINPNRIIVDRTPRIALIGRYFDEIKNPPDERSRILLEVQAAESALQRGEGDAAVAGFQRAREEAIARPALFDAEFLHALSRELAVADLRLGEQQNCVAMHNPESCLFPLAGGGVHTVQTGPRAAVKEYLAILERFPEDLTARWLLNVAYMTIGEYPDKVPEKWLIPPSALRSDYDLPRFPQVAAEVGLNTVGRAGGVIADDFDGDGLVDLMVSRIGLSERDQVRFFHNDGTGTFTDRTAEAGLTGITGGLNIMQTDYDNDGRLDFLIPRGAWGMQDGKHPLSLLHNDGNGHFTDVTVKAGLLSFHPILSAVWADFDNDGFLDLFLGRESVTPYGLWNFSNYFADPVKDRPVGLPDFHTHPCALYHNNGDGTFTDVAAQAGADVVGLVKGVTAGDYDNDGRMDIYISRLLEPNVLLHNDGSLRFTDVTKRAGVADPIFSFPTWFWDYDNDGWLDIFVGDSPTHLGLYDNASLVAADYLGLKRPESKTPYATHLYRNNHDGTFADVSARVGLDRVFLPMGSNYGDLDNDGWPDFYLGTGNPSYDGLVPNRMFRNDAGKRFQDVTTAGGFGHLQKGHGVAFADLDNDGDQDVYVVMGGAFTGDVAYNALFENPGNTNHFIKLMLEGVKTNRSAVGARLQLTVDTPHGPREIFSTVSSGGSFGSSPFRREIGLGDATGIRSIVVTWPTTGKTQRFEGPPMDCAYRLREGEPQLIPMVLHPFKLGAHHN
jgi:FG-GAP-like repeat/ASPIC and UnbV